MTILLSVLIGKQQLHSVIGEPKYGICIDLKMFGQKDSAYLQEAEWEYAARAGHNNSPYPWGAYGLRNSKGCLLANFKPRRGNYPEDGGLWTVKASCLFP